MVLEGCVTGSLRTKNATISLGLPKNRIIVFPRDAEFIVSLKEISTLIFIDISKATADEIFQEFSISIDDQYLEQAITSLRQMLSSSEVGAELEANYIVRALLARIVSKYATMLSDRQDHQHFLPRIQSTLNYIEYNLHGCISVSQLAKEAGLGQAQYARLFKRTMNTTFHQYVINRRVEKARKLLVETRMSAAEIAFECGFADQVHLTRFFKKITGATPIKFRRAGRH
jgi:AraC family transcriptional regulator